MSDANTPPGAAMSESELAAMEAQMNLYIERGGPDNEVMYFEDFVSFNDVRRLIAALRLALAENEALRRAYEPSQRTERPKTLHTLRTYLTDAVVNGVGMRFNAADIQVLCDALGSTFNDPPPPDRQRR